MPVSRSPVTHLQHCVSAGGGPQRLAEGTVPGLGPADGVAPCHAKLRTCKQAAGIGRAVLFCVQLY